QFVQQPQPLGRDLCPKKLMPVALPPGRARLATRPNLTGSSPTPNTIGIVEVAALAASEAGLLPGVAITATRRRTRSAMSDGKRSYWPSSQWYSTITFWPSTVPVSLRPMRNAAPKRAESLGDRALRKPTIGTAVCCWARAASGHADAPPIALMKSRRRIAFLRHANTSDQIRNLRPAKWGSA